jgi:hypothetical protein
MLNTADIRMDDTDASSTTFVVFEMTVVQSNRIWEFSVASSHKAELSASESYLDARDLAMQLT